MILVARSTVQFRYRRLSLSARLEHACREKAF